VAKVSCHAAGVVREVYRDEGDWVAEGEALCRVSAQPGVPGSSAQSMLAAEVVRAPFDGRVARRYVDAGDAAIPGRPLFAVVKPDSAWVVALVDDTDAGKLAVGQKMRVSAPAYLSQPIVGRITHIGEIAEPRNPDGTGGKVVRVRVDLPSLPPSFKPGVEVDVDATVTLRNDALLCPVDAIIQEDEETFVWLVRGGRVRKQAVRIGLNNYQFAEVLEGLAEGDIVVTAGKTGLAPGRRVRATLAATE